MANPPRSPKLKKCNRSQIASTLSTSNQFVSACRGATKQLRILHALDPSILEVFPIHPFSSLEITPNCFKENLVFKLKNIPASILSLWKERLLSSPYYLYYIDMFKTAPYWFIMRIFNAPENHFVNARNFNKDFSLTEVGAEKKAALIDIWQHNLLIPNPKSLGINIPCEKPSRVCKIYFSAPTQIKLLFHLLISKLCALESEKLANTIYGRLTKVLQKSSVDNISLSTFDLKTTLVDSTKENFLNDLKNVMEKNFHTNKPYDVTLEVLFSILNGKESIEEKLTTEDIPKLLAALILQQE